MRLAFRLWLRVSVGLCLLLSGLVGVGCASPSPAEEHNGTPTLPPATSTPQPTATVLPLVVQPFAPLLYDDFAQITSGWTPFFVDQQGTVNGYSAETFAFSTANPGQLLFNVLPSLNFAPTRYAVELQPLEGAGIFGLLFEVRGNPTDYASLAYYGVGLGTNGEVLVLSKAEAADPQVLQTVPSATSPLGAGQSARLTVNRLSDRLSVLVNETEVLTLAVPAQAAGTIGFFVRAVDRLAVRFDNLLLTTGTPDAQPPCASIRPLFDTTASGVALDGADVVLVQRRLAHLGYIPGPEGLYGSQTAAAVAQFQTRNGLPADGVVGAATWCRLLSSEAVLVNSDQSERTALQERYRAATIMQEAGLPVPLLLSVRGAAQQWQIALALPDRTSLHYIDTGGDALDPAWLPSQGLLAFTSHRLNSAQGTIWLLDTASGAVKQISASTFDSKYPAWSPDGRALMFTAQPLTGADKQARNYIYTLADGRLTEWRAEQAGWSDWSPVGTVVFTRWTGQSFDLFAANADGSNAVNLTNTDDYHEDIPAWSPSGDRIAFVRNPKAAPDDRQVYTMQADGSEVQAATTLPGPNSNPIWLDANTLVLAHQSSAETRQPYLIRRSGAPQLLIAGEERVWFMQRFALQP